MARTASAFDFNPHEREARDDEFKYVPPILDHFNPHEREARDIVAAAHAANAGTF